MPFRKPCHMPFRKLMPSFTLTVNGVLMFIVCETKFTIGESRTISHANETQAQQVQNLAQEDFPPKLLWNEIADFKFSVNTGAPNEDIVQNHLT